jgi:DNA-binding response OmpR family regulator
VADDEMAVTTTVALVLRRAGHEVDVAHDGDDAMALVTQRPGRHHIVITDHAMQRVSGLELVMRLQAAGFPGKVLVLSAHLTTQLKDAYLALGVKNFIHKPFDLSELRTAVDEMGAALESMPAK